MKRDKISCFEDRESLLNKLHSIVFAAFLTYLPSEGCLEISTMTNQGTSCQWIAEEDWGVYKLQSVDPVRWETIVSKLRNGKLTKGDIQDTCLAELCGAVFDKTDNLVEKLAGLCDLQSIPFSDWYCFHDCVNDEVSFFVSQEDLKEALANEFSCVDVLWEELDDDSLINWIRLYDAEGQNIPCYSIGYSE